MIEKNHPADSETLEILSILQEEAAEVIVVISKIDRFGWLSCHPNTPDKTNLEHLEEEIGDFMCMIGLLEERGMIRSDKVDIYKDAKLEKLRKYSGIKIDEL